MKLTFLFFVTFFSIIWGQHILLDSFSQNSKKKQGLEPVSQECVTRRKKIDQLVLQSDEVVRLNLKDFFGGSFLTYELDQNIHPD